MSEYNGFDMVAKRLDRIENKLDKYSDETIKFSTRIEDHLANTGVHYTVNEARKELKLNGNGAVGLDFTKKQIAWIGILITAITTAVNTAFAMIK